MYVYNPDGFEPKDHLPRPLHAYSDCARVLVHLVETARVFHKLHDSVFVPRKAAYLRRLVHKEMYKPIREALIGSGVLDWSPRYVVGKKSYGFRIGPRFENSLFRRYKLSDRGAIRRVQRVRAEQCPILTSATLEGLRTWLDRLKVDYESAWASLRGLNLPADTLRQRHMSLAMLRDGEFFFRPDLHGRVHTNLTNLWSGFRQFLRFTGERLVNIDIGNSQPLFFGLLVMNLFKCEAKPVNDYNVVTSLPPSPSPSHYDAESINSVKSAPRFNNLPQDVKQYLHVTEQAQFYEHMMTALGITITRESRDAFKHDFFAKVFYCKPNYYTRERKAFEARFPTILQHITWLKRGDARNAPLALQRTEGDFVIRTVCERILGESPETPLWTIHDSIMTTASRGQYVRQVMLEEFARLGVHPHLEVEELGHEPMTASRVPPLRSRIALDEVGSALLDGNPRTLPLQAEDEQRIHPPLSVGESTAGSIDVGAFPAPVSSPPRRWASSSHSHIIGFARGDGRHDEELPPDCHRR